MVSHQPKLFFYYLQVTVFPDPVEDTVSLDSEAATILTTVNVIKTNPVFYKMSTNEIKLSSICCK